MINNIRKFKVIERNYPTYGQIGVLIGDIDYCGCYSGWHTIKFPDDTEGLFTGSELVEITENKKE